MSSTASGAAGSGPLGGGERVRTCESRLRARSLVFLQLEGGERERGREERHFLFPQPSEQNGGIGQGTHYTPACRPVLLQCTVHYVTTGMRIHTYVGRHFICSYHVLVRRSCLAQVIHGGRISSSYKESLRDGALTTRTKARKTQWLPCKGEEEHANDSLVNRSSKNNPNIPCN